MNPKTKIIDLRSDTVTTPTAEMRKVMIDAAVGDDVYGEDPTVNSLEQKVAKFFGHEAALFTTSGTLANQIAIHLHTRPGDTIIAEEQSHVYLYEVGASAALSGVQYDLIPFSENFSNDSIDRVHRAEGPYTSTTKLLLVENTHNRGSGKAIDAANIERLVQHARDLKMLVHCDGARIWNACAVLGEAPTTMAAGFDSVSVCFSKGLGAPVGSALLGTKDFIARARKIRKRWGGGMRQVGILAAAAIYAMDHHLELLPLDHKRMRNLIDGCKSFAKEGHDISVEAPELNTNICYLKVPPTIGRQFHQKLWDANIRSNLLDPGKIRLLTHFQIDDSDIATTLQVIQKTLRDLRV